MATESEPSLLFDRVLEVSEGGYKPGGDDEGGLSSVSETPEPVRADPSEDWDWAPSTDWSTLRLQ